MSLNQPGFKREIYESHKTVFLKGDAGDSAYVIESGSVEVLVGNPDNLHRIAIISEGEMFGEVALLDRQSRSATVRTLEPTVLLRIDRNYVEELLNRADPVVQYLLRILLERFRSARFQALVGVQSAMAEVKPDDSFQPGIELQKAAVRTLSLAHDLSEAIDGGQLELYYQPIIHLADHQLAGYESLLRWHHPSRGMISPDEFIPIAEKTGLIHRIGQWVLNQAAQDWQALRGTCMQIDKTRPFMSVNLSAPELCGTGIVKSIEACLQKHRMPADELRIELTETIVISNMRLINTALDDLRGLGVGIALDDFGTGYAGLDYLQNLPFSCLKIDKAFVQQLHTSEKSAQIIAAALDLSRQMYLSTVAEGIEDEQTSQSLTELGCTYGQGYHFARPMPIGKISHWISQFQA
jgi:diguanylate cyclase